jgi:hypothetical protein
MQSGHGAVVAFMVGPPTVTRKSTSTVCQRPAAGQVVLEEANYRRTETPSRAVIKRYDRQEGLVALMNRRTVTLTIGLVDGVVWAFVAFAAFSSGSDAATKGLDQGAGLVVTVLFLFTGAPALALAWFGRAPIAALMLALAFPIAFVVAFVAAVIAFA